MYDKESSSIINISALYIIKSTLILAQITVSEQETLQPDIEFLILYRNSSLI